VYRQHVRRVARWVARLGGPELDLEDTVHEIFVVVRTLLPRFRGDAQLATWLYEITARVVHRERRRGRWRRWLAGSSDEVASHLPSPEPTPLEELERRQATLQLYRILDGMAEKYRTAFVLYELEGMSGPEIAQLTGLNLKTVWVRVHRARQQFHERVAKLERAEAVRLDLMGTLRRGKEGSR
jgi:RNA polymerase sigma-70 factor (ECF subfamily)